MLRRTLVSRLFCSVVVVLTAAGAYAQTPPTPAAPFQPQVGQAGKDVVWVPTPQALVDAERFAMTDYLTTLAEAGITGSDVRVYATIYVAEQSGVNPHPSQRGDTLVFKKDSAEYNRVKYLVDVATGVREARAAKKAKATHARITPEARKAAKAYLAQFDSLADARRKLAI